MQYVSIRLGGHAYTSHFLEYEYHHTDGKPLIKIYAVITMKNVSYQH